MSFTPYFLTGDLFLLIPTISLAPGRCPDESCDRIHGFALAFAWLNFEAGLEIAIC